MSREKCPKGDGKTESRRERENYTQRTVSLLSCVMLLGEVHGVGWGVEELRVWSKTGWGKAGQDRPT